MIVLYYQCDVEFSDEHYLAITAVQPEVREEIFNNEMIIPTPCDYEARERLLDQVRNLHELQQRTSNTLQTVFDTAHDIYGG